MEAKAPRPRGRPRKRQRPEDENRTAPRSNGNRGKKQALEVEPPAVPISLLGRYVLKDFGNDGTFLGKIVSYETGLYRVEYEDGDFEDMETADLRPFLIEDDTDNELCVRRSKLDKLIVKKEEKKKKNHKGVVELQSHVKATSEADDDADSDSSDCEDERGSLFENEGPVVPPLDLPPSSQTIAIPEEAVVHLLSVYGFLRSFSFQLYICPFELDDFVGALKFSGPNSLLDSVHVALLRALKAHLERLSADDSDLASKCLKYVQIYILFYLPNICS